MLVQEAVFLVWLHTGWVQMSYRLIMVTVQLLAPNRWADSANTWRIEQGSVLDSDYMSSLGKYDIIYSWGVLCTIQEI